MSVCQLVITSGYLQKTLGLSPFNILDAEYDPKLDALKLTISGEGLPDTKGIIEIKEE